MPRRARIAVAGVAWHIIQRGNNRSACFYADEDYRKYLQELAGLAEYYDCRVHAYVLMTNHVHLLVTPERSDGPSLMMKHLGQRYVQYVNRKYHRTGTLWEGRFRSCLVEDEHYVLACYRYIELNPVRAGMVNHPADYLWSSYRANGQGEADPIITTHVEYEALGGSASKRQRAYRALFDVGLEAGLMDEVRTATNGNYALGSEAFRNGIARTLKRRAKPGRSGRPRTHPERKR